jgi:hypothetical protein
MSSSLLRGPVGRTVLPLLVVIGGFAASTIIVDGATPGQRREAALVVAMVFALILLALALALTY